MTEAERARLAALLGDSRDALRALAGGLTEAEWHARPRPDAWSPLQIVEHLAITERSVLVLVTERLPRRPPAPDDRRSEVRDDDVVRVTENREKRLVAPDRVQPQGPTPSPREVLAAFEADRAAVLRYVDETRDDLRARLAPHPIAGVLDAYQWLLFLGAHTNRHVAQLGEVALR